MRWQTRAERFRTNAVVTVAAIATLVIFACSPKKESSPPPKQPTFPTNAVSATKTNFAPPLLDSIEPASVTALAKSTDLTPKQLTELKAKAEKGDAQAQFELGTNYWMTAR